MDTAGQIVRSVCKLLKAYAKGRSVPADCLFECGLQQCRHVAPPSRSANVKFARERRDLRPFDFSLEKPNPGKVEAALTIQKTWSKTKLFLRGRKAAAAKIAEEKAAAELAALPEIVEKRPERASAGFPLLASVQTLRWSQQNSIIRWLKDTRYGAIHSQFRSKKHVRYQQIEGSKCVGVQM